MWEKVAKIAYEVYGAHVDWEERFFECPECGEPIYKDDWEDVDFVFPEDGFCCPVCDFLFED